MRREEKSRVEKRREEKIREERRREEKRGEAKRREEKRREAKRRDSGFGSFVYLSFLSFFPLFVSSFFHTISISHF